MNISKYIRRIILLCLVGLIIFFLRGLATFIPKQIPIDQKQNNFSMHVPIMHVTMKNKVGNKDLEGQKNAILDQYRLAWAVWHAPVYNFDNVDLSLLFSEEKVEDITARSHINMIPTVDLEHNIDVWLYSLDERLIEFTDTVLTLKNIENNMFYDREIYQILMILEDTSWKLYQIQLLDSKPLEIFESSTAIDHDLINGMNYYPKLAPWKEFWKNFDTKVIKKDMTLLAMEGYNTVRIFIPEDGVVDSLTFASTIKSLKEFLHICKEKKITVVACLFDFHSAYSMESYTKTFRQLIEILTVVQESECDVIVDLKNEPDLDFTTKGKENVKQWLSFILDVIAIKQIQTPITIGWSKREYAEVLSHRLHYLSWHDYTPCENTDAEYIEQLRATGKPLLVSEYGYSSYSGIWNVWQGGEEKQKSHIACKKSIYESQHIHSLQWTMYNFDQVGDVFGHKPWVKEKQKKFGVFE